VQAAFEVAEQHGYGLNAFFFAQVFKPLLLNLLEGDTILTLLFRVQIHLFQFVVRDGQKISQFARHESPYGFREKL
jgi:hypothetical protein